MQFVAGLFLFALAVLLIGFLSSALYVVPASILLLALIAQAAIGGAMMALWWKGRLNV